MSKERYTARAYDGSIRVYMFGTEYILTFEEARRLQDSLSSTLANPAHNGHRRCNSLCSRGGTRQKLRRRNEKAN